MARPRRDGKPSTAPDKRKLSKTIIKGLKPRGGRPYTVWDTTTRGLVIRVHSSSMTWKVVYSRNGRPRWYHIGNVSTIPLTDARTMACRIMLRVGAGEDPQAERRAERGAGTFEDLAARHANYAKKKGNKSWGSTDALIKSYVLKRWGKLLASEISRSDAKALMASINAPITANQVMASASSIFAWAIREEIGGVKINPCHGVERNPTRSRERVLSDSEVPLFWKAFDSADDLMRGLMLKTILLTGQRPGEVSWMRTEHLKDGWWEMPGQLIEGIWPGTKNSMSHRVWIPAAVQEIITIAALDLANPGFVFANPRGNVIDKLDCTMRDICKALVVNEKVTPHDLRRSHGTTITSLGYSRDCMNRVQNHKEGGVGSIYDRYSYERENKEVMEATANKLMGLILPTPDNVVPLLKPLKTLKN
jgi:integrase